MTLVVHLCAIDRHANRARGLAGLQAIRRRVWSCLACARALAGVDLAIAEGESVAVVGPADREKRRCSCARRVDRARRRYRLVVWRLRPRRVAPTRAAALLRRRSTSRAPRTSRSSTWSTSAASRQPVSAHGSRSAVKPATPSLWRLRDSTLASRLSERVVVLRAGESSRTRRARRVAEASVSLTAPADAPSIHATARLASRCVRLILNPPTVTVRRRGRPKPGPRRRVSAVQYADPPDRGVRPRRRRDGAHL